MPCRAWEEFVHGPEMPDPVMQTTPTCNHGVGHDAPDPTETESKLDVDVEKEFRQSKGNKRVRVFADLHVKTWVIENHRL